MKLDELKQKLLLSNAPERWYSIDDGLKADAYILYKNYSIWEYFYLDERGNRLDYKIFKEEEEAYEHLWQKIKNRLEIFKPNK